MLFEVCRLRGGELWGGFCVGRRGFRRSLSVSYVGLLLVCQFIVSLYYFSKMYHARGEVWWGKYRVCMDDPTARGAANFLKLICDAIEGLLAATVLFLLTMLRGWRRGIEGFLTPAQRLLGCPLCQHCVREEGVEYAT
jgi:hypothetical protein